MRFTDRTKRLALWSSVSGLCILTGCASSPTAEPSSTTVVVKPPPPRASTSAGSTASTASTGSSALAPPSTVRNWNEVRLQAARRMVAANPQMTYMGEVPEPLLAIPVLDIELNGDGSVRRIQVMRNPSQALDTVKLATDAVHRAAPFGDVSRLPKPWRFTETFLFNDDRKFKPRTLDQ